MSAATLAQDYDAIIVGSGPVGLVAALALNADGFRVALIERGAAPAPYRAEHYDARVYAITPASARLLERLRTWSAIAAARVSPYRAMRVWDQNPTRGLSFDAAETGAAELGWIVEHGLLLDAAWAQRAGIECYPHTQVQALRLPQDEGGTASLDLDDGRSLRARLVIAADGADSRLRELAGIDITTWNYPQRAIVCHVRTGQPHAETAWQRFLPTGPLALLPLADGRCSIVWSADTALADALLALDDAAFCARLEEASERALGSVRDATPRIAFPLRLLHAQEYARAGFALIGDAAHAIHPLAGQGVNLGFADVAELAATLVDARDAGRDWASARTLARYTRARKAANLEMLAVTDGLYRAFGARAPGLRTVLALGMDAVDRLGPLKTLLMRQAASG